MVRPSMGTNQGAEQGPREGSEPESQTAEGRPEPRSRSEASPTSADHTSADVDDLVSALVGAGPNCTTEVWDVVTAVAGLGAEPLAADLTTRPGLADSVIVLATINVLQAQLARRVRAAAKADVLCHTPRATLPGAGGLPGPTVSALLTAAASADQHHGLGQLWASGATNLDAVAAIARGLRPLTSEQRTGVLESLLPHLPHLGVHQIRRFVSRHHHHQRRWPPRALSPREAPKPDHHPIGPGPGRHPAAALAVGRSTRLATAAQRRALVIRDAGCVIPGCDSPASECQTHHVTDWAIGGPTDFDNLALTCWSHPRQVDLHRW